MSIKKADMGVQEKHPAGADLLRRRVIVALALIPCVPWLAFAAPGERGAVAGDLDTFVRLSAVVTGVEKLDRETARRILELIRAEPWGKEHLAQIGRKLLPFLSDKPLPADRNLLLDPKRFTDGERWFIGHLLTTWYTGIYYHQRGNHVAAYRGALMYAVLEDVRPVPGYCEGAFGFWSEPPEGIRQ